jgi:hypothetical protein
VQGLVGVTIVIDVDEGALTVWAFELHYYDVWGWEVELGSFLSIDAEVRVTALTCLLLFVWRVVG